MDPFASILKEHRIQLGLDQVELGRRVGVGQQAVSRWESGGSRPRRPVLAKLALVLDVPVGELLSAAGYVGAVADSAAQVPPAVKPLTRALPFNELAPDRFEDASVELIEHLHPGGHASRFGGPGERQWGIDLLLDGELHATAQCKRHAQFGPKDVQAAIEAVEQPGEINYLFLSRQTATAEARRELAGHDGWELWDGEDMSRYVRTQMSPDEGVRFVDTYFPNHRESFLGLSRPGPWLTAAEFYASMSGDQVFTQDWTLVGRQRELGQLESAILGDQSRVTELIGRGGIGKSRLLRSVAEGFGERGWFVRMLPAGAVPQPSDFELLPSTGSVLIIVDDAHERSDVGQILARVNLRNPNTRVLIACRPYGMADLEHSLRGAGLSQPDVVSVSLSDLTLEEAGKLAREALGLDHQESAERLAALTRDCPLATTVGGHLIRTGALNPRDLEQSDDIRREILLGFRDVLVAESAYGDPERRRAVVDALSILQPFRSGNSGFQEAISGLVGLPFSRIVHHLRSLEDSGVLIRRGDSLRVVPDLLGDVVLADACFDRRSRADTGYLKEVMAAASGEARTNAFLNASRVDWQVGHHLSEATAPFWKALQSELEMMNADTYFRTVLLLGSIAGFQADRVVEVVRWILDHPIETTEQGEEERTGLRTTWRQVLEELPAVLRRSCYSLAALPAACRMLWELSQSDARRPHQHPNHPLRVLREVAEFAPGKPLDFSEAVLGLAETWIAEDSKLSALEVLEPIVATEGSAQTYSVDAVHFHPFAVNQTAVSPVRRRAIDLALREIESGDAGRGVAGARFLESALRYPSGMFGRGVEVSEQRAWDGDFVETIEALRGLMEHDNLDPVVFVAIMELLYWHIDYGEGAPHEAAEAAAAAIPKSIPFEIALLVHDEWGHLIRERGMATEQFMTAVEDRASRVAQRALTELETTDLVALLEERVGVEMSVYGLDNPGGACLLSALVEERPSIAEEVVAVLEAKPRSSLSRLTSVLVGSLDRWAPDKFVPTVTQLLEHPDPRVRIESAVGLAARSRRRPLYAGELDLLRELASSPEVRVRIAVLTAAGSVASTDAVSAADLLASVPFSDSPAVAEELFRHLSWDGDGVTWVRLTSTQRLTIASGLRHLSSINGHQVQEFLRVGSARDPQSILELLRLRIEDAEGMERLASFEPVPHWYQPLAVREHRDFLKHLRLILGWLGAGDGWLRRYRGKPLFAACAGTYDSPVLTVLLDTLRTGSEAEVHAVASAIEEAPNDLIMNDVTFVLEALEAAEKRGTDALQVTFGALQGSAILGTRWGVPGEPFAEDVRLRDECAAIADSLPMGSLGATFYTAMSELGARQVLRELDQDRGDGRMW